MLLLFLVVALCLIVYIQNKLYRKRMFHTITYHCYFSKEEVYEGDEIEFIEEITNAKWLPIPWFKSEFTISKYLEFAQTLSFITEKKRFVSSFFYLKSNKKVKRVWKVKCVKRGVFEMNTVTLIGSDILGNYAGSLPVTVNIKIVVLPKPIPIQEIVTTAKHLLGDIIIKRQLVEDPFYLCGIREYIDSDPMNRINWLATAKEQKLMVNQNGYTTKKSIQLVLNIQSQAYERDYAINEQIVEDCIRIAAEFISQAQNYHIPIGLLSNTKINGMPVCTNLTTGRGHALDLYRTLAHLECLRDVEFDSYLANLEMNQSTTDCFIITSYINDAIISFAQTHANVKIILVGFAYLSQIPTDCDVHSLYDYLKERGKQNEAHSA
jgi:uncharacterized protein (DUF58 family)